MDTFELLIYHTAQENASIEVVLKNETIWATQKAMAQLFGIKVPGINKHVNNILREGELQADKVISKMETTTAHGAIEGLTQTKPCQKDSKEKSRMRMRLPSNNCSYLRTNW